MYLIYDVETVIDAELLRDVRHPGEDLDEVVDLEKAHQLDKTDGRSDFIPLGFHLPVALTVAKVLDDFTIENVVELGTVAKAGEAPTDRDMACAMVETFWQGVMKYKPILVDFNGRSFDLPLLTVLSFRYGIPCPAYFAGDKFGYRYRYTDRHIDLMEWLTDFGAWRMAGGLDFLAKCLGREGKTTKGDDVAELFAAGKIDEIRAYCKRDVIDTYAVFLRTRVMMGQLEAKREEELVKIAATF